MKKGIIGKKIGMTQIFDARRQRYTGYGYRSRTLHGHT